MSTLPAAPVPQLPAVSLPQRMTAGDLFTWAVQTQLPAGSAVSYFLTAALANGPIRIAVAPVAVDAFGVAAFSVASAVTKTWTAAAYQWVCFGFDLQGNRTQLASGQIAIEPDPGGVTVVDTRSRSERLLANIRALLEGKSLEDATMYKIGSRELTKMPHMELLKVEAIYEARVRRERIRKGQQGGNTNTVGILFGGR